MDTCFSSQNKIIMYLMTIGILCENTNHINYKYIQVYKIYKFI
jgi:hypothetical protein